MDNRFKIEKHVRFSLKKNSSKREQVQMLGKMNPIKKVPDENLPNSSVTSNDQGISKGRKESTKPKKRLVRYVEENVGSKKVSVVPLLETPKKFDHSFAVYNYDDTLKDMEDRCKYDKPELFSSLTVAKKMQLMNKAAVMGKASISRMDQEIVLDKTASKVSFGQEEQLYRDLVSLAINEGDLMNEEAKRRHKHAGHSRRRDLEPQLCDFFQPSFCDEYSAPCQPKLRGVDRIRRYNGLSLYKCCQKWKQMA